MRRAGARRSAASLLAAAILASGALTTVSGVTEPAGAATLRYYLSLGDSVAQGYQPGYSDGSETLHGYSNLVVNDVAPKYRLRLENFGCGGATTGSILVTNGCRPGGLANNGISYPTMPQAAAALAFIHAHHGQIGLITITIGWNDFGNCVGMASPSACVTPTLHGIEANLKTFCARLRAAAGASTPIVGMSYTDADIADWLQGASGVASAKTWISLFRSVVNPTFARAYKPSRVTFLDITAASGAYVPLSSLVQLAPYGAVPFAVSQICKLTWMCKISNDEMSSQGYALIASQIAKYYLHRPT